MLRKLAPLALLAVAALVHAGPHKVSPAQAQKIALAKVHGNLVGKPKLENEDNVWQYAMLIKVGKLLKEVGVNAETGKITAIETVTAAEEAKEAKEDALKAAKAKKKGN